MKSGCQLGADVEVQLLPGAPPMPRRTTHAVDGNLFVFRVDIGLHDQGILPPRRALGPLTGNQAKHDHITRADVSHGAGLTSSTAANPEQPHLQALPGTDQSTSRSAAVLPTSQDDGASGLGEGHGDRVVGGHVLAQCPRRRQVLGEGDEGRARIRSSSAAFASSSRGLRRARSAAARSSPRRELVRRVERHCSIAISAPWRRAVSAAARRGRGVEDDHGRPALRG